MARSKWIQIRYNNLSFTSRILACSEKEMILVYVYLKEFEENKNMSKVHSCQSFSQYWDWMGFSPIWARIYVLLFQMAGPRTTSSISGKVRALCSLPPTSPCPEASKWPTTPTSTATWPRQPGSIPASESTWCSPGSFPSISSPSTSPASWSWLSPGSPSGSTIKR